MKCRPHAPHGGPSKASAPSSELIAAVERVRARLLHATDFAELYDYIDEQVASRPDLWPSSKDGGNDRLVTLVAAVAAELRSDFVPQMCAHFEIRNTGFWHGMMTGDSALVCFFYDARVGTGVMSMTNPFDGRGLTHFVRITRVMLEHPGGRMPN
ncbi:MAG: hypothetical protein AB1Z98_34535 [Nannocystaceae bacterium]